MQRRRRRNAKKLNPTTKKQINQFFKCKKCAGVFVVAKEFHMRNRMLTHDNKEHGGNMTFDMKDLILKKGEETDGEYNSVDLPRGVVDWHTHPRECKDDDTCAIGIPSPTDLANVVVGFVYGTVAHLVYSKEGTYCIQVKMDTLEKVADNKKILSEFQDAIVQSFLSLHHNFLQRANMNYNQYRKQWLAKAKKWGFRITFFKGDTQPVVPLRYDCNLRAKNARIKLKVEVPDIFDDKEQKGPKLRK